jgi:polysaccharide biosynthesis/export protein
LPSPERVVSRPDGSGLKVMLFKPLALPSSVIALIAGLIAAASLSGCAAFLNNVAPLGSSGQVTSDSLAPRQDAAQGPVHPRATQPADAVVLVSTTGGSSYKIGPLDVLDISVFKVPELSKTVQVAGSGTINLPLVGEIPAAGKTTQQLERDLTSKLGATYLQNPQVTVFIKEYNSQRVTVEGAVKTPGVYPVKSETSLLQVIAMAGDFQPESDSTILILRSANGKRTAAKFDVSAIQTGRAQDPILQSGDVIIAGTSAIKKGFSNVLKALPVASLFTLL